MRKIATMGILAALGGCQPDTYFISGTAVLPDCSEDPIANLDGTTWFDQGSVTVLTEGCPGASADDVFQSCPLNWVFTQLGNDVTIIVDTEYRIEGRFCGNQLYLKGGWWLPVLDEEVGSCTYDDDSAEEVGILQEGNVLTYTPDVPVYPGSTETEDQMTGTLQVRGRCAGEYEVMFLPAFVN
ncbi:MAG: hypothetical protein PVH21_05120 [Myxococcales bacterium]|jgi:hypothetical protein